MFTTHWKTMSKIRIKMYKKLDIYKTLHQWKTCTENITCGYFKVLKHKNNFLIKKTIEVLGKKQSFIFLSLIYKHQWLSRLFSETLAVKT